MESTLYAGLDVHKNSIEVALAEGGREGEVRRYGRIGGDLDSLDKVVRKLVSTGKVTPGVTPGTPGVRALPLFFRSFRLVKCE